MADETTAPVSPTPAAAEPAAPRDPVVTGAMLDAVAAAALPSQLFVPTAPEAPAADLTAAARERDPGSPETARTSEQAGEPVAVPPPAPPDWRAALEQADAKELRAHPRLSAIVGELTAKKQQEIVAKARQQWEADQAAIQAKAERLRLAREDPDALAARELSEEEQRTQRQAAEVAEAARLQELYGKVHQTVGAFAATLPAEVAKSLEGKTYEGSYEDGFRAYLEDAHRAAVEHEVTRRLQSAVDAAVKAARDKWVKEERPAVIKEALTEANGSDRAPDVSSGASPRGLPTLEEFKKMSPWDPKFEEVSKAIFARLPAMR